jgi:hypothetical protein
MLKISVLVAGVGGPAMSRHFFHCTDGVSFFADQQGRSITPEDDIFLAAMRTAEHVTQRLPSMCDWSGWLVSVYDELGQMVEVFDFPNQHPAFPAWPLDDADRETAKLVAAARPRSSSPGPGGAARASRLTAPASCS